MKMAFEISARVRSTILTIAGLMTCSAASLAAELQSLSWDMQTPPALLINLDGRPEVQTETLDGGRRLRVKLADTTLAAGAVDIPGQGATKGAFPYLADADGTVHVDLLLRNPGTLQIEPVDSGLRVTPVVTVALDNPEPETVPIDAAAGVNAAPLVAANDPPTEPEPAATMAADNNVLQEITFTALPGGRVQINIRTEKRPEQPGSFSTNKPARLAFDFFGMRSALQENVIKVGAGAVDSIATVETDDRTRIVLNLVRAVSYDTEITDTGLTLVVEGVDTAARVATTKPAHFAESAETADHGISRVDFRRSTDGGGRIIVDLSDPAVGIDIREESGTIVVDFLNTQLPGELEQRLDVVDFATPVQNIDTYQQGANVRMVITPTGRYQHLAYQAGNVFTVSVTPVIEDEEEKKADEFGYTGEKLSLSFQKISVRAALQVIADFTGLNFVTSDSVKGTLTLRLQDVPWDQALDIILQTRGLGMRQKGNVVWVAPASEIAARERAELEANKQVAELEPLISELIQINYAKAADLAKLLKSIKAVDTGVQQSLFGSVSIAQVETDANSLLSPRGNVTVDARTNTILIQDTAAKIREVRKLIAELDKPVRQVLIETRIVEATDDFSRVLGSRLGFSRVTTDARLPGINDSNIGDVFISGTIEDTTQIRDDNTTDANGGGL
ncbi:MAG: AMIN domain-containing protein, partial [Gammaproteobacteria bacterium]|nr:AMIN domain-containing protein [Gammaproteobacteria bacterium]